METHPGSSKIRLADQGGFTLIDLMITVSIIGILTSIALPNYQNFLARSRQTEAKIVLASVYTAEAGFFGENTSYTTCLDSIGFNRAGLGFYYTVGFGAAPANCGSAGTDDCHQIAFASPIACTAGVFPAGGLFLADRAASGTAVPQATFNVSTATDVSNSAFKAAAVGRISVRGAMVIDVWTIDDRKLLFNETAGI